MRYYKPVRLLLRVQLSRTTQELKRHNSLFNAIRTYTIVHTSNRYNKLSSRVYTCYNKDLQRLHL